MQFELYKQNRAGRLAKQATNNQPTNQPTDQPTNQPTNQLTSQPTNRGADLPNYSQNKRLRPPVPRILHRRSYCRLRSIPTTVQLFIVVVCAATAGNYDCTETYREGREGGREEGGQKVALKSLKLAYVQVETLKFTRPCTLACNCKFIWDSDFDKVGGRQ